MQEETSKKKTCCFFFFCQWLLNKRNAGFRDQLLRFCSVRNHCLKLDTKRNDLSISSLRLTRHGKRSHKHSGNVTLVYLLLDFSLTQTAPGLIWFWFSMNYHSLDPVSADKAWKCPSCIFILPMNIQHLALFLHLFSHPHCYLTVPPIIRWRKMWQREMIYDLMSSLVKSFNGLTGASFPILSEHFWN